MTDERMGDALWVALARLPRGSGVVFRHYDTPAATRQRLFAQILRVARRRRLVVLRSGAQPLRGEMGTHNRPERGRGLRTFAAHDARELGRARRHGADLIFVSPVFPTRSHPKQGTLGVVQLGLLVRDVRIPVIALGGIGAQNFGQLRGLRLHGWAGIDAWLEPDA